MRTLLMLTVYPALVVGGLVVADLVAITADGWALIERAEQMASGAVGSARGALDGAVGMDLPE